LKDANEGRQGCGGSHDSRLYRQNPTTESAGWGRDGKPRPQWRSFQNQDSAPLDSTKKKTIVCCAGRGKLSPDYYYRLRLQQNISSMPVDSWLKIFSQNIK
jgi:hypothetical protein